MNKKGFTLVEVLAVITILSLIITIVATNGFGAFNNAKGKINEEGIKEITEGAKVFLTDVEFCDETLNENIFSKLGINDEDNPLNGKCDELQTKATGNVETEGDCIEITLENLKSLGYVSSNAVDDILENNPDYKIRACLKEGIKTIKLGI